MDANKTLHSPPLARALRRAATVATLTVSTAVHASQALPGSDAAASPSTAAWNAIATSSLSILAIVIVLVVLYSATMMVLRRAAKRSDVD